VDYILIVCGKSNRLISVVGDSICLRDSRVIFHEKIPKVESTIFMK
jgi:hypothetical protein